MSATRRSCAAACLAVFTVCAACTATQVQDTTAQIGAVCATVQPLASEALALPTVGPFVAAGVLVGCTTDAGIARLATDPSSAAWLNQQAAMLHSALGH
jgi:hypothetical protein